MPRIRTLKPEIWDSPDFMDLDAAGQLTFIALISLADDHGRLRGDARHLHLVALRQIPADEIGEQLQVMEGLGMAQRYRVEGRSYIQLLNWSKHQKVDHPKDSVHPSPPALATVREDSRGDETNREDDRPSAGARADRIEDLGRDRGSDLGPDRKGESERETEPSPSLPVSSVGNGSKDPQPTETAGTRLIVALHEVLGRAISGHDIEAVHQWPFVFRHLSETEIVTEVKAVAENYQAKGESVKSVKLFEGRLQTANARKVDDQLAARQRPTHTTSLGGFTRAGDVR